MTYTVVQIRTDVWQVCRGSVLVGEIFQFLDLWLPCLNGDDELLGVCRGREQAVTLLLHATPRERAVQPLL